MSELIKVTDEMVSAALAEWYPDEWPHDPVFQKMNCNGVTFHETSMKDMRKAIEAAILRIGATTPDPRAYGEWCRHPSACAGKGYCPLVPTCGD